MVAFAPREAVVAGTDPPMGGDLTGLASNAQLVSGSVGATELATNAVTSIKIADGSVTTGKLAAQAVNNSKVDSNAAVAVSKLAGGSNLQLLQTIGTTPTWVAMPDNPVGGDLSGTVTNAQLVAGAVGTPELAALGVTDAKIASGLTPSKITPGAEATVLTTVGGVTAWAVPTSAEITATINVKGAPYNAAGDCQTKRGGASITAASSTLTVTNASFVVGDVGKTIAVKGAGLGGTPLVTTIASRTSATIVVLSSPALVTVAASHVAWGTDDTGAWQAALDAIPGTAAVGGPAISGGRVIAPPGKYLITSTLLYDSSAGLKIEGFGGYAFTNRSGGESEGGARLVGVGQTILKFSGVSPGPQVWSMGFEDACPSANGIGANGTGIGIHVDQTTWGQVFACNFSSLGTGVLIDGTSGGDSSWWRIKDTIFYTNGIGVDNQTQAYGGVDGGGSMEIESCIWIVYGTQRGVRVRDAVNYVKIRGGKMDLHDGTDVGIQIDAGKSGTISGVTFEHHDDGDIPILFTGRGLSQNWTIEACEAGGGGTGPNGKGISLNGHARQVTDGVTTNAGSTLTSATANFQPCDAGLKITGTGLQTNTLIATVTNATTVTLNKPMTATATGVTITISNVLRDVTILGGHMVNFGTSYLFGTNVASCAAVSVGGLNFGTKAVTFAAATGIAAAATSNEVRGLVVDGATTYTSSVSDLGVGNVVTGFQNDSKRQVYQTQGVGTPTGGMIGDFRVANGALWFMDSAEVWQSLAPAGSGPTLTSGAGSPIGVVAAPVGSLYTQTDADTVGSGNYPWLKVSGPSVTGWEQLISVDGNDHWLDLYIPGALASTANQTGPTVCILPFQMTLKRMKVVLGTAATGAMVVQLKRSIDNGTNWTVVTGFTVTYANTGIVRTVDPTDTNVNEGDLLAVTLTTASGSDMHVVLTGNAR